MTTELPDPDSSPTQHDTAVLCERHGAVLQLTLNNPRRKNALTGEMIETIIHEVDGATSSDAVRVITLRANGKDFCTGIDLAESNSAQERPKAGHLQRRLSQNAHRMIRLLHELQLPVVAGVSGWAAGIGNALALSADVVIADETAKFWVPFVGKGFTPDSANTYLLPRLIGIARAKEMILRSKPIGARQALEWGLIGQVVAEGELDTAVNSVADEFSNAATLAVGLAKTLIHRNLDGTFADALANEAIYEELAIRTDDFKEGIKAFMQKRPPEYTGR